MKNSIFFLVILIVMSACNSQKAETDKKTQKKPNIVLIVADDLGYMDLGSYGNTYFESPNLDRLSDKGIRFTNTYSASHVCSPTRSSFLTGRYPARTGVTNYIYGTKTVESSPVLPAKSADRLPLEEITIAEELKKQNYVTGLMGKWHLGENTSFGESDPEFQGFDHTIGFDFELLPVNGGYEWYKIGDTSKIYKLPEITQSITKNSVEFIEQHKDTSFFLMVSHFAVHLPLQGDSTEIEYFKNKTNPKPDEYNPVYASMIKQLDTSVGDIMKSLKANNLLENTIVIFISDNGGLAMGEAGSQPTTNAPYRSGKGTMYEGGIKIPMIAFWKNHTETGVINNSIISTVDIFPTLLSFANAEASNEKVIDGENMKYAFLSDTLINRDDIYFHYPHFSNQGGRPASAIRNSRYKLIEFLEDGKLELYDIIEDPYETTNIASNQKEITTALHEKLLDWRENVNANMPIRKDEK
ncbi:sulfatase [Marinigracilibium pacificum]|uniref:Sulfatase n=1 Tax=Marinigracilibium pacificum TaxID=2729599 RepID=A0A848J1K7_9BACT|nr:sulfatase [Marinigracilibium pacificum]NMM48364.1 sulfatase [Marinigracilibium pacificum]